MTRSRRPLQLALGVSLLLHLLGLFSPGLAPPALVEREGEAVRLEAVLSAAAPPATPAALVPPAPAPRPGASSARLPTLPEPAASDVAQSSPPEALAPVLTQDEGRPVPEPAASPTEAETEAVPPPAYYAADRLPRRGRVRYTGSGGGFITLGLGGEVRWQHDGVNLSSRLSAGINSLDGQFEYESRSLLAGEQIVSLSSQDRRLSKHSSARIEQAEGMVYLQRGEDARQRTIKGVAVAISALPQVMQVLDASQEKVAFFVVGDFWVEDAVLVAGESRQLRLPQGAVDARHYQTRTNNGSQIDIWLAPAWHNAPVRIRIAIDGWVIDLRADEVEIDGRIFLEAPPEPEH